MRRILLIHPYGNINHNPNLHAIVQMLDEHGLYTDILCPQFHHINQKPPSPHSRMIFIDSADHNRTMMKYVHTVSHDSYDLVMGVDTGIIPAASIFRTCGIPYALISYELTFTDEVGYQQKKSEIESCRHISFAVCQDSVRSFLLSRENTIHPGKIFHIPVAGRYNGPYKKSDYLRKKFSIDTGKKIALYAGSISSWGMIDDLIDSVESWPQDWVLVLHPRYGEEPRISRYVRKTRNNARIYISDVPMETPDAMQEIVSSSDAGIAFYKYDPDNPLLGKNILFIGMASGKLAMYLKYGIPVVTNEIGQMSEHIRHFGLGAVVPIVKEFNPLSLHTFDSEKLREKCTNFFKETLDFRLYEKRLLSIIRRAMNKKDIRVGDQILPEWNIPRSVICQLIMVFGDYYDLHRKLANPKISAESLTGGVLSHLSSAADWIKKKST